MYKLNFNPEDLKTALEDGLGFTIGSLKRLSGGGAINFKAERSSDGLEFLVKCFVPDRKPNYDRLVSNLKTLEGVKAPLRLFEDTCPKTFGSYHILCLAWCHGETSDPSQMSDGQWMGFLNDYLVFADRMQQAETASVSEMPLETWRGKAFGLCKGLSGWILRPALSPLEGLDLTVRREDLRVVHGDFHTGNVLFCDGAVECFMDVENLTLKYAPADILLYCVYAARRLDGAARQRVCQRFGEAVRQLPFSGYEWQMAIAAAILSRLKRRTKGFRKFGLFAAMKNASEVRLYEPFRQQVLQNANFQLDQGERLRRRLLTGSSNIVMIAPRRYGKTSLVAKVLRLMRAADDLIAFNASYYSTLMRGLSESQKTLVFALANEPAREFGEDYRYRHNLPASSTVHSALDELIKDAIVANDDDAYRISDPFLSRYVRSALERVTD